MFIQPRKPSISALTVTSSLSTKNICYIWQAQSVWRVTWRDQQEERKSRTRHILDAVLLCTPGMSEVTLPNIHLTSPDFSPEAVTGDTALLLLRFCKIQSSGAEENSESTADIF